MSINKTLPKPPQAVDPGGKLHTLRFTAAERRRLQDQIEEASDADQRDEIDAAVIAKIAAASAQSRRA